MIASSMSFDDVQAPQPCVRRNSATQQAQPLDLSHLFGYAAPPTPPGQPRVEIISHTYSAAQEAYNSARGHDDGATFYKDATPRSDHHLKVSVRVPGVAYAVPIRLAMCYAEDGSEVSAQDATSLKILGDGRKQYVVPAGGVVNFSYRFELGSFRRADRKFCVKISADARDGLPLAHAAAIGPALTPGVLVLSKKKLEPDHPEFAREASLKRKRDGVAEDASDDVLTKVLHRLESLERAVTKLSDALGEASPGHPLLLRDGSRDSARAITRDPSREPSRAPSPTPMPRFERQRSISPNDQIAAAHLAAF